MNAPDAPDLASPTGGVSAPVWLAGPVVCLSQPGCRSLASCSLPGNAGSELDATAGLNGCLVGWSRARNLPWGNQWECRVRVLDLDLGSDVGELH